MPDIASMAASVNRGHAQIDQPFRVRRPSGSVPTLRHPAPKVLRRVRTSCRHGLSSSHSPGYEATEPKCSGVLSQPFIKIGTGFLRRRPGDSCPDEKPAPESGLALGMSETR